ncbi:MAG TPA: hypothetical protein DDW65_02175 [Firmicutes bacterium]|nr:hypothetical protein [Bacillota bacterium]
MSLSPAPNQKSWLVAADMGLGHQRAANPLKDLSDNQIITAGTIQYSTFKENKLWKRMRKIYEGISRVNHIPIIGGFLFGLMDKFQDINPYYPFRDLSSPTIQVNYLASLIKKGLGRTMVDMMRPTGLPLVTTFFAVAMAADYYDYPQVYLLITDTDLNRVWVAKNAAKSRINYFASCGHAVRRLKQYGVPDEQIFLTGFPLPKENLGSSDLEILKLDLAQRLIYLDPSRRFWALHQVEVEYYLGAENCVNRSNRLLTLTFAVGGAGAQKEIGVTILAGLKSSIQKKKIRLNLVAGVREEVHDYFMGYIKNLGLEEELGTGVNVLYSSSRDKYFTRFNLLLRTTDILWTKPSELSFYSGLGIPIIIAPPLGSHEHYNKKWLLDHRAGIPQEDPCLCEEWLFDLLNEGRLAQTAWDGFLNTRKCGTYKIENIITTGTMSHDRSPLKR